MQARPIATTVAIIALGAVPLAAQTHHSTHGQPGHHGRPSAAQPYAGLESRPVKALSEEQILDLRAGRGMRLALAAELNGYPGPLHVLELAEHLGLSPEQRSRTQTLFEQMKEEAILIGNRLISEETALDRLFAERNITAEALASATARIGAAQAELRAVHLRYHLTMVEVLSPQQVARYNESRGYGRAG